MLIEQKHNEKKIINEIVQQGNIVLSNLKNQYEKTCDLLNKVYSVNILAKLDIVIAQNETIIFRNRSKEIQNETIIQQNNQMLGSLKRVESNAQLAAEYAQISASYNETTAYFTELDYFRHIVIIDKNFEEHGQLLLCHYE